MPTLLSGNTFGAKFWSDAKREAPMLPDSPAFVVCNHCNSPYWVEDATRQDSMQVGKSQGQGQRIRAAGLSVIYAALEASPAMAQERNRYLRIQAWWKVNDPVRQAAAGHAAIEPVMDPVAESNLRSLLSLLDPSDPSDLILQAEIHRETCAQRNRPAWVGPSPGSDSSVDALGESQRWSTDAEAQSP